MHSTTEAPSCSGQPGRSWDGEIEPVYSTSVGVMTKAQYLGRKQRVRDPAIRFDMFLGDPVDCAYPRRSCLCGGKIEMIRGKAVCQNPHCSTIFNDGGNTTQILENGEEASMVVTTRVFDDGHKEVSHPAIYNPRKTKDGYSHLRRFISSCKF